MTDYEKIDAGMRLMAEGCAEAKSCEYCPFRKLCDKQPSDWFNILSKDEDDEEENYDCDWGYNEDMGYDPYEGCYTWDC